MATKRKSTSNAKVAQTGRKKKRGTTKAPSPARLAARKRFVAMVRARSKALKAAKKANPGVIKFTEKELAKYGGKIKGLVAGSSSRTTSSGRKRRSGARFKKTGIFGGSGLLGLGRSSKRIKVNTSKRQKRARKIVRATRQRIVYRRQHGSPVRSKVRGLPNPRGQHLPGLPAKYQRMYEDILASSGSKRIAAATTKAAFARQNPSLFKKLFGKKRIVSKRRLSTKRRRVLKKGYQLGGGGMWGHRRKPRLPNPSPSSVFSEFRGKQVASRSKGFAAKGTPAQLATLGRLKELRLRGKRLSFGGRATLAASGRKRLYVANVRMKRPNPSGEVDYGEIVGVIYYSDKPHIETGSFNYDHKFESPRPHLVVDEEGCPKIEGGGYKITEDGIEG